MASGNEVATWAWRLTLKKLVWYRFLEKRKNVWKRSCEKCSQRASSKECDLHRFAMSEENDHQQMQSPGLLNFILKHPEDERVCRHRHADMNTDW